MVPTRVVVSSSLYYVIALHLRLQEMNQGDLLIWVSWQKALTGSSLVYALSKSSIQVVRKSSKSPPRRNFTSLLHHNHQTVLYLAQRILHILTSELQKCSPKIKARRLVRGHTHTSTHQNRLRTFSPATPISIEEHVAEQSP